MLPFIVAGVVGLGVAACASSNCGSTKKSKKLKKLKKSKALLAGHGIRIGSPVYNKFLGPAGMFIEHSGIYIGDGCIVSKQSDGTLAFETLDDFREGMSPIIYHADLNEDQPQVALNAIRAFKAQGVHSRDEYNVIFSNCHMFTVKCITGVQSTLGNTLDVVSEITRNLKQDGTPIRWSILMFDEHGNYV